MYTIKHLKNTSRYFGRRPKPVYHAAILKGDEEVARVETPLYGMIEKLAQAVIEQLEK